ncbi:OmpA family protein [Sphaerotilus sp.]|uniref:OmpA family protein n=1 Tax=Sphaerotilus sp. TaxID=2093942 RepID=UPI00286D7F4F|nr:OmpA family protein [Sphaerotilus sp.]
MTRAPLPRFFPVTLTALAASAAITGCSNPPLRNERLEVARIEYRAAQNNPQARTLAAAELQQAGDALVMADKAWANRDSSEEVDHLAYLTRQRVAIAQEMSRQKVAEHAIATADADRDKVRLAARTDEADAAQRSAQMAQRQAEAERQNAELAQRKAQSAERDTRTAQQQASESQARTTALEVQINALNAKKTDRGLVITLGDVLFDNNRAQLKPGGTRSVEKLAGFLKQYPQRKVLVEGFTDSVGSDSANEALSTRRADAVRGAMVDMGVADAQISTHGHGEAYPVASNTSAAGRQFNRRVEIVLSDDSGNIPPR